MHVHAPAPHLPAPAFMRLLHTYTCLQIKWRLSDEAIAPDADLDHADPTFRANTRCMIFLGFTSNLTSAGVREHIRCVTLVVHTHAGAWISSYSSGS